MSAALLSCGAHPALLNVTKPMNGTLPIITILIIGHGHIVSSIRPFLLYN